LTTATAVKALALALSIGVLRWLELARATLVHWPSIYWWLTASFVHLDRLEEGRASLSRLLEIAPHTTLAGLEIHSASSDGRFRLLIEGLKRTGLK